MKMWRNISTQEHMFEIRITPQAKFKITKTLSLERINADIGL